MTNELPFCSTGGVRLDAAAAREVDTVNPSFSNCEDPIPLSTVRPMLPPGLAPEADEVRASNDTGIDPAQPPGPPRLLPTEIVTIVSFVSELTVVDPAVFRYRWVLTTARRTTRDLWTYLPDEPRGAVLVTQQWHVLFPDAASASVEVEGGTAGPVAKAHVAARQAPTGRTLAVDAV